MRSDEILYTGSNGVTADKKPTARELQREKDKQAIIKLKPAAEVVLEAIATEVNKVTDIRSIVTEVTKSPEELSIELKARSLYLSYLNSLEFKINQLVKKGKK
jgi:tRNA threonylcarbamoyladenosine modification (KEOPS) complex  Pcc1 subunit